MCSSRSVQLASPTHSRRRYRLSTGVRVFRLQGRFNLMRIASLLCLAFLLFVVTANAEVSSIAATADTHTGYRSPDRTHSGSLNQMRQSPDGVGVLAARGRSVAHTSRSLPSTRPQRVAIQGDTRLCGTRRGSLARAAASNRYEPLRRNQSPRERYDLRRQSWESLKVERPRPPPKTW